MSPVEVIGRDVAREAYRVRVDAEGLARTALVPECLMETLRPGERPSHQEAYEWIAAHRGRIEKAVIARAAARTPRPPYDLVTLAEES
ncbi:hypothetical protein [Salipiger abyssi]|uniref:DUF1488 family protein n=1 Tax=Salipiger abyssi TaxID=1250539 RepID=A0A1P8V079_9RHOB|nr:hypothetical protein [Salipiger abyssi]APZ55060.1 hypothetical protein Ga0080574_TMP4726 [Salipiger abyssi]MBN9887707.1 hypothetical protein [Salipiger abyssi]